MEVLDFREEPLKWNVWSPLSRNCWGPALIAHAGADRRTMLRKEQAVEKRKTTARYRLMEAISMRDATRLAAAIGEGESAGLAANELLVGQSMFTKYQKDGFMVGVEAT